MDFQPGAQVLMATIHRVGNHPIHRHASVMQALKHLDSQIGFRAEGDRVGNARLLAARTIVEPVLRHVEFAIDEGMATCRDVGEEHAHLTVLHLASGATILLFDARRMLSTLGNYVLSKINTLDQQEDMMKTDPLADCLPGFSVAHPHPFREQE